MLTEFSAREVTLRVLEHLERRRPEIAPDLADGATRVRVEVDAALAPVEKEYVEAELPRAYLDALLDEIRRTVPGRWGALAADYTRRERAHFGLWRGGDPVARITYVLVGLLVGSFILWAPFIPIWEKWVPFALAIGAWFIPDIQVRFHRRRYAVALGQVAMALDAAQPQLDARFSEAVAAVLEPRPAAEALPPREGS